MKLKRGKTEMGIPNMGNRNPEKKLILFLRHHFAKPAARNLFIFETLVLLRDERAERNQAEGKKAELK